MLISISNRKFNNIHRIDHISKIDRETAALSTISRLAKYHSDVVSYDCWNWFVLLFSFISFIRDLNWFSLLDLYLKMQLNSDFWRGFNYCLSIIRLITASILSCLPARRYTSSDHTTFSTSSICFTRDIRSTNCSLSS